MPSSKAVLADITKYNLRIDKKHNVIRADGTLRPTLSKDSIVIKESELIEKKPVTIDPITDSDSNYKVHESTTNSKKPTPRRRSRKKALT